MRDKILVCGCGPSLPGQLKDKDLSEFKVVRVNPWEETKGYDNKCDAWAFYPHHHLGEALSLYDVKPYIEKAKEIWMPHWGFAGECVRITGRHPDYTITEQQTKDFHKLIGHPNPTSGAVVVYMATLLDAEIYIAGFDFYQEDRAYCFSDKAPNKKGIEHHKPLMEKEWFDKQIKNNSIYVLQKGANKWSE